MAGSYPDPPGYRLAWDVDGTTLVRYTGTTGTIATATPAERTGLNGESDSGFFFNAGASGTLSVVFPALMDLTGLYARNNSNLTCSIESSADTTNGQDGSWTTAVSSFVASSAASRPGYRTSIVALSLAARKALRIRSFDNSISFALHCLHLYGFYPTGQNPNRLELRQAAVDARLPAAAFDWGDAAQGTTADVSFRVKNLSPTQTANNVVVSMAALTTSPPTLPSQHSLSLNGSAFAASQTITSIAPGGLSPVLTLRRTLVSNAVLGPWSMRVQAVAGSWA